MCDEYFSPKKSDPTHNIKSNHEKLLKFKTEGQKFAKSREQIIGKVKGQTNFWTECFFLEIRAIRIQIGENVWDLHYDPLMMQQKEARR